MHHCGPVPRPALAQDSDWLLRRKVLPIINSVGASVMLAALGSYWLYFVRRLIRHGAGSGLQGA